jgi:Tfp pilus assembly protein PilF
MEQIRAAYRALSHQYHPDKHMGNALAELAAEKLWKINAAYAWMQKNHANGSSTGGQRQTQSNTGMSYEAELVRAQGLLEERLFDEAHRRLNAAIIIDRSRWQAYALQGYAYSEQESWTAAKTAYSSAVRASCDDADVYAAYASAMMQLDDAGSAATQLDRAMDMGGRLPRYLAFGAVANEKAGNNLKAQNMWEELKRVDPTNPVLQQRNQAWKVGKNYVNKGDAAGGACVVCALLECIFDCI